MPDLRSVGRSLASAGKTVALAPVTIARFTGRQAVGTYQNFRGFLGWLTLERSLPPALASTIRWVGETVPVAVGVDDESSYQQISAAGVLLAVAISSTLLTLGLTLAAVVVLLPLFLIGLWRLVPAFNSAWRNTIQSRDGRVPRWDR